ncbi:MAG: small subunit ribosomal protein S11 [Parcubacteria group bacterium Gr01-1014_66]|nr:MAG: small subunit ribosomal protein S11 [Parcubacteria group bacterium Gr01-1014_66]
MGKKRIIKKGSTPDEREKLPGTGGGEHVSRKVTRGIAHIQATYNNTMIMITDEHGNALAWCSAGSLGFSGAKKATPFAAARVVESLGDKMRRIGLQEITVRVSGVGAGRDSAIRALANQGLHVSSIKDVTPLPHNGPRPKKMRRV